ncbi:MAG: hypothetical protein JSU86_04635 [Phycisphaerales bacterium]|nr:MAG: hypothetical protein JSU86_04635 [Phycisphaerales bacterium]
MISRSTLCVALTSLWGVGCRWHPEGDLLVVPDSETVFHDDFDRLDLDSGWTFEGAATANYSLTERPGFMRIYAQDGQADPVGDSEGLLLRYLDGDFSLVTRMEFETLVDLQLAGLVIGGDDGRTVAFGLLTASGPRGAFRGLLLRGDRGPDMDPGRAAAVYESNDVLLRLERIGDSYTASYSSDGFTYTLVGTVVNDLSDSVRVGIGAAKSELCSSSCDETVPADFDFFEITWSGERSDGRQ